MKAVVPISGGVDSTTLIASLLHESQGLAEIVGLYVEYGQQQRDEEEKAVRAIMRHYGLRTHTCPLPNWDWYSPQTSNYIVPFRNGIIISLAVALAQYLEYNTVAVSMYSHPDMGFEYPDTTAEFLLHMKQVVLLGTDRAVRLLNPFGGMVKTDVIKAAMELEVPLDKTWTCYMPIRTKGKVEHCGQCPACKKLKKSLKEAGHEGLHNL